MNPIKSIRTLAAATFLGAVLLSKPALAATPYVMSTGNYSLDFADIANWQTNFTAGIGSTNWGPVPVNASGTLGDGVKITSAATFSSGSSGGIQKGTGNIVMLSTSTANSCAMDLYLDFTGRNAGTVSFDAAEINNSTGDRVSILQLFYTTDGTTFTELTGTSLPFNATNNLARSAHISVSLPSGLSGASGVRLRFYERSTTFTAAGANGSQPKISIDNVAVTSTGASGAPPVITSITPSSITANAGDTAAFTVASTGDPATYYWYKATAVSTNLIPSATGTTLTLTNVLAANTAGYFVVLSNATPPMATSSVVTLTVMDPYIASQPANYNGLLNGSAAFTVGIKGTQPVAYQWYVKPTADADFSGMAPLSNGGRIIGANTNVLTVTNLAFADATNLFVIASNSSGSVTSSVVALTVSNSTSLAYWNFNGSPNVTNPAPTSGFGSAAVVNTRGFTNASSGLDFDFSADPRSWGTDTYPAVGASNKTAGVRFNVSTLGAKNLTVTYDTRGSATGSKYERLQYTTNGVDFLDYPTSSRFTSGTTWESRAFNLAGFPGVANNTNFAARIVTEFESTAKYGATNNAQYVGITSSYATSGTVSYDIVNFVGDAITNANLAPTISSFTNVITTDTSVPTVLNFTVGDDSTSVTDLVVTAVSYDQTVMPDGNLIPGGVGTNRTLTLTPVSGGLGVAPILVTVTDGNGDLTKTWFYVTVNPGNQPPTLSGLVNTNTLGNITNIYAFTVGDDTTPAGSLTVTAVSGNSTLVPNDASHLSVGGSGSNRTLIVSSAADQYGTATITVNVNDGEKTTPATFVLVVRPNTVTLVDEGFDYDASGAIINVSAGYWQTHSGTAGQIQVGSGVATLSDASSEDINAPLIGQPYSSTNKQVLYSSFTMNCTVLPTATGNYFAHFKDNTSGGFYGRVFASTTNAAPGTYRIGIGNQSANNTTAQIAQDLTLGVNYTVVTRLVMTNGFCTIWIDPTDESSPSMTDTTAAGAPSPIISYAFRESGGEGSRTIDNLKVGLNFLSVITNIVDVPPQANADSYSVGENTRTNAFSPLLNDVLNLPQGSLSLAGVSPTNGTATISGTNILFTPATNYVGTATIGYTITDGFGGLSTALITVTVTNNPPQINPDAYTVMENSVSNQFNPLLNDVVNTAGGTLSLVSVSPSSGTAAISGTNVFFTPATNFAGIATIGYTATDGIGGTNSSTITVTVTNNPPVANPDAYSVNKNSVTNRFSPLTNDLVQTAGGTLSLVSVSPATGTATISGTNVLFTPASNFVGGTTIGYTITDNIGGTNTSVISVTVVDVTPIPLTSTYSAGNLILSWSNPAFTLQTATNVTGPYLPISGATSPFTNNTTTNAAGFFRLVQ